MYFGFRLRFYNAMHWHETLYSRCFIHKSYFQSRAEIQLRVVSILETKRNGMKEVRLCPKKVQT